jgi:archaellum component FlaC
MSVERNDVYKAMWWLEHQRVFFFGAFLIGSAMILTLKSLNVNNSVISGLAIFLMLVYAATGIKNKLKVRLDILGDNLYYLGFLYTLVSLSYSLYTLGKGTADINNLLENFGLAIMTTLCGLALRVFFNQPKADIAEYENTIRLTLTETTANFVAEASKIGTDISTLRTVLNQVVQETQEAQRASNQVLSDAVTEQIGLLEVTANKNQENIQDFLRKLEDIQNSFAQNFEVNTNAMKKVITGSMRTIEKGAENFTANFENINAPINDLKNAVNSITDLIHSWDSTVEKLSIIDTKIQEKLIISTDNLSKSQSNLTSIVDSVPIAINKAISNFEIGLNTLGQQTTQNNLIIDQNWDKLNTAISKFSIELRKVADILETKNLKSNSQSITEITLESKNE